MPTRERESPHGLVSEILMNDNDARRISSILPASDLPSMR